MTSLTKIEALRSAEWTEGAKICLGSSHHSRPASWTPSPQLYSTRYNEQIDILGTWEELKWSQKFASYHASASWMGSTQSHQTRRNKPIDILGTLGPIYEYYMLQVYFNIRLHL